jgi:hypothetical protein
MWWRWFSPMGHKGSGAPLDLPLNVCRSIVTPSHPDCFAVPVPIVLLLTPPPTIFRCCLLPLLMFKCPPPMPPTTSSFLDANAVIMQQNAHHLVVLLHSNSGSYKKNNNWQLSPHVEYDSTCGDNRHLLNLSTRAAG